jgi:hypothetical protein
MILNLSHQYHYNLNSIKNTIYQMPYENGQKTLLKFLTYFREMKESLNEK